VGNNVLVQPSWYVNAVTGSDANDGTTALTPLLTLAELYRRTVGKVFAVNATVYLSGDFSAEALVLDACVAPGVQVTVRGEVRQDGSYSVGAYTAYNGATSTPAVVSDGGATAYAGDVGKIARMTSGAAINCSAPIMKATAAGAFRPGHFQSVDYVTMAPGVGDTYVVEELLTKVGTIQTRMSGSGGDYSVYAPRLLVRDLDVYPPANTPQDLSFNAGDASGAGTLLYRVRLSGGALGNVWLTGSGVQLLCTYSKADCYLTVAGSALYCWGFVAMGGLQVNNSILNVPFDMMLVQGHAVYFYGGQVAAVAGIGFLDIGAGDGAGLIVSTGANVEASAGTSYLWSNGNLCAYGIRVGAGSMVTYGVKPTATGVTNDTLVGGTAKAYAAIPYFEAANGAGIVVYQG
jgi:hypothetical protein